MWEKALKYKNVPAAKKEKLTISSDDVLFSNLMLWFKVLYWEGGEKKKASSHYYRYATPCFKLIYLSSIDYFVINTTYHIVYNSNNSCIKINTLWV